MKLYINVHCGVHSNLFHIHSYVGNIFVLYLKEPINCLISVIFMLPKGSSSFDRPMDLFSWTRHSHCGEEMTRAVVLSEPIGQHTYQELIEYMHVETFHVAVGQQ